MNRTVRELGDFLTETTNDHREVWKQQKRDAGLASDVEEKEEEAEPMPSVRDGWEELLHLASQHLYGTRGASLNPLSTLPPLKPSEQDMEKAKREERRKALQTNTPGEKSLIFEYLLRLCPPATIINELGERDDPHQPAAMTKSMREKQLARHKEIKGHLRRLLPTEAAPRDGEGHRLWLVPMPQDTLPKEARSLLAIPSNYLVDTGTPAQLQPAEMQQQAIQQAMANGATAADAAAMVASDSPPSIEVGTPSQRSHGAQLCSALASVECLLAEHDWSVNVLSGDLIRLEKGRLAGVDGRQDEKVGATSEMGDGVNRAGAPAMRVGGQQQRRRCGCGDARCGGRSTTHHHYNDARRSRNRTSCDRSIIFASI